ncbi:hypothetical protein TNCV_4004781 [Trichonephila clavipes]|nr:hypothetical protein TNCV_4004781 [Trichonephila clavipes]
MIRKPVRFSNLRLTNGVLLAFCHDEFRRPRSNIIGSQVALKTMRTKNETLRSIFNEPEVKSYIDLALQSFTRANRDKSRNVAPWSIDKDNT